MRWSRGAAIIERSLAERRLQKVSGASADGAAWLDRAERAVDTAEAIAADDPDSAYDAARQACTGLLAHQGLRPTTAGGALRCGGGRTRAVWRCLPPFRHATAAPERTRVSDVPDEEADPEEVDVAIRMTREVEVWDVDLIAASPQHDHDAPLGQTVLRPSHSQGSAASLWRARTQR
jgi:hypothetical protein